MIVAGGLLAFVLWFVPLVPLLLLGHPVTVTQWDKKHGERQVEVGPGKPNWIRGRDLSRHVFHAIVTAEDGRFYRHYGIDPQAMWESLELNRKKKRYARGGSTITQQVVKMAFLTREKTIIRKLREVSGAVLLDMLASKDQILEWYVNLAEFGDGVYGMKAASRHYFATKPELLTIEQAIHLAIVIPSPNRWSKGLRRRDLTRFGEQRFAAIARNMRLAGYITETQWATALSRGNFGRPLQGHEEILAAGREAAAKCAPDQLAACAGATDDLDLWGEDDSEIDQVPQPEATPADTPADTPAATDAAAPVPETSPVPDVAPAPAGDPPVATPTESPPDASTWQPVEDNL